MSSGKGDKNNIVLVNAATGKCGFQSCLALVKEGFEVYGTTRSEESGKEKLESIGVKPLIGDYTSHQDFERFLEESNASKLFLITDFWTAAKCNVDVEYEQGKMIIDTVASSTKSNVQHIVYVSVAEVHDWPKECSHILAKIKLEEYIQKKLDNTNCFWSIVGPVAFFENFDDSANWNPLTKGSLKFLMTESLKWCATYDVGKAAAVQFKNSMEWNTKRLDVIGYEGDLNDCADALEKVGGYVPVQRSLAVPIFVRRLFMKDLHYMCEYYAKRIGEGIRGTPEEFKKHVPDALDAEGWFRHHNKYANGNPIVGNTDPVSATKCVIQ